MAPTPVAARGYARPELLVETGWLAVHLDDPSVRLIDARTPEHYASGHIPGAVNLTGRGGIPRNEGDMGAPEEFAAAVGALGIGNDSTVIVYDEPRANVGMVAWAFTYYGHKDVRMLDGGLHKWTAEGRALSTDTPRYPAVVYTAEVCEEVYCSLDTARRASNDGALWWDVRSDDEFHGRGDAANQNARPGHIPGAVHLEWTELLDPETRTFRPAAELKRLLASRGITAESRVYAY